MIHSDASISTVTWYYQRFAELNGTLSIMPLSLTLIFGWFYHIPERSSHEFLESIEIRFPFNRRRDAHRMLSRHAGADRWLHQRHGHGFDASSSAGSPRHSVQFENGTSPVRGDFGRRSLR